MVVFLKSLIRMRWVLPSRSSMTTLDRPKPFRVPFNNSPWTLASIMLPRRKPGLSIKVKAAQILLMVSLAAKLMPPMIAKETKPQIVLVVICSITG